MRKVFFMAALLLALSFQAVAQKGSCLPMTDARGYQAGEQLSLSLMYKWGAVNTEVGTATLSLENLQFKGEDTYHTSLQVKTAPFFDVFFKMREDFQSWFRVADLKPLKFHRDTYEGGYWAKNDYLYDWSAKVIHANIDYCDEDPKSVDIPLTDCAYDLPTLLYCLRSADIASLKEGVAYPLSFALNDKVQNIRLTYKGKETLKVRKVGKVATRRFSVSVITEQVFDTGQELQLWFSDDENCIPVAIMMPLKIGSVRVWLKSYSNLKYPFTALQK